MGVHGLWRLLDTFGEVTQPADWKGKRVAIDASIWIAQFRSSCEPGESVEERILEGFFMRILKLLFYGIEPIFVFDGPSTMSKRAEQRRRAQHREALEQAMVTRHARRLIAAQMSAGLLDVHSLPRKYRSPGSGKKLQKPLRQSLPPTDLLHDVDEDVGESCVETGTILLQPKGRKKRTREVCLAPEVVSRSLTHSFLSEAEIFLEQRKTFEKFHENNRLAYTSTSIFMGPRRVAEEVSRALGGATRGEAESIQGSSAGNSSSSSVLVEGVGSAAIVVEEECGDSVCEILSSSSCSVIVVDNAIKTDPHAVDAFHHNVSFGKEEESTSDEVEVLSSGDYWSCADNDCDDLLSLAASDRTPDTQCNDSTHLWYPGTQLLGGLGSADDGGIVDESRDNCTETSCGLSEFNPFGGVVVPSGNLRKDEKEVLLNTSVITSSETLETTGIPLKVPSVSREHVREKQVVPFELLGIVELLDCCGIPYVLSPNEADAQCAFLNEQRVVDAVFTEDSDVIVHGAPVVLRGFFSKGRHVVAYHQSDLLACGVDKVVLVALALLLGCDYAEGVNGLSLLESLHVIAATWRQTTNSVEGGAEQVRDMLSSWCSAVRRRRIPWGEDVPLTRFYRNYVKWSTLQLADSFPESHVVDAYFNPTVNTDTRPFVCAAPDWTKLRLFASMHGILNKKYCGERLENAQRECQRRQPPSGDPADSAQRRLTDFFSPLPNRERVIFRKQPPKFSEALSYLRAARGDP
ncbi:DNA repair protein RAD2, putative [Trypanosoma equiperdum]|uniref:DNA repair protein RAD2, putative n=1 Tax=Trypanosoma equiperdum TaxID=5694 RepID=A0A1G4I9M9_TRYEQ|nr:DNA repair protein RAD2, putative [Trypanosoma equiperdum]